MKRFSKMNEKDMVATAMVDTKKGETAQINDKENTIIDQILALEDIPFGNKIAVMDIQKGDKVIKYGAVIGECTATIKKGELVHVHNVKSLVLDIPTVFKKEIIRQMKIEEKEGV